MHRVARAETGARRGTHFHHGDGARVGALGDQPADQRRGHVAAAEERDPHAASFCGERAPKIAVPMRTMVAPSVIARSRSSDMPIDSVSKPNSPFSSSKTVLTAA